MRRRLIFLLCSIPLCLITFILAAPCDFANCKLCGRAPIASSRIGLPATRGAIAASRRDFLGSTGVAATAVDHIGPSNMGGTNSIGYKASSVTVGGVEVPLAVWYPVSDETTKASASDEVPYAYRISVAKIFRTLVGLALPAFLAWTFKLRSKQKVFTDAPPAPSKAAQPLVVFAHGYLGSRFDMLHLAELLVSRGFVVAAPEFAESLSASFEPNEGTPRVAIMEAALEKVTREFGTGKVGVVGHSAGGGTVAALEGNFELGRVAIAGGGLVGRTRYDEGDPLFAIMSEGDCLFRGRWREIQTWARAPMGGTITVFEDAEGASTMAGAEVLPRRVALLFNDDGSSPPPPSHISFLDPRSNDSMVSFLSPLLPLARLLGVPVLDFDVYQERQDSEATSKMVLPCVLNFLEQRA